MKVHRSHFGNQFPDREIPNQVAIIINIIIIVIIHQACASFLKNTSSSSIFLFSC
jgi:hypothetical protein